MTTHSSRAKEVATLLAALLLGAAPMASRAATAGEVFKAHEAEIATNRLVAVVEGEPVNLIETLAQRLADVCLASPRVVEAEVTVHKPEAPIRHRFDDVSVTVSRRRA